MVKMETCIKCGGSGEVWKSAKGIPYGQPCPACNGFGKVIPNPLKSHEVKND